MAQQTVLRPNDKASVSRQVSKNSKYACSRVALDWRFWRSDASRLSMMKPRLGEYLQTSTLKRFSRPALGIKRVEQFVNFFHGSFPVSAGPKSAFSLDRFLPESSSRRRYLPRIQSGSDRLLLQPSVRSDRVRRWFVRSLRLRSGRAMSQRRRRSSRSSVFRAGSRPASIFAD